MGFQKGLHVSAFLVFFTGLVILTSFTLAESGDSEVSVSVEDSCQASLLNYDVPGYGDEIGLIAVSGEGYFSGTVSNIGNQDVEVLFNQSIYPRDDPTLHPDVDDEDGEFKPMPLDDQPGNYTFNTSLPHETQSVNETRFEHFLIGFVANYRPGNYTGVAELDFVCDGELPNETEGMVTDQGHFEIIDVEGEGVIPDDVGEDNEVDQQVDTDAEHPDDAESELDTDANQTDTEADEREGDGDFPGETPVPEPEPDPVPDPDPRLMIEIDPVNHTYQAVQGQFAPALLEIENFGEEPVEDISLEPLMDEIRPEWEVQNAAIDSIEGNETLEREVFVRPPIDEAPGTYTSPVVARDDENRLDMDYFMVEVLQAEFESRLSIIEAPQTVNLEVEESMSIPVLLENSGRTNVSSIEGELQNMDSCGSSNITVNSESLEINESVSMNIELEAGEDTTECQTTLIVSTEEGAYAFSDLEVVITPEEGLIPREQELPFTAIAWTLLLAGYAVMKKKYELNSALVNIPFIVLILGETLIILYMIVNYYGIMTVSFLPF